MPMNEEWLLAALRQILPKDRNFHHLSGPLCVEWEKSCFFVASIHRYSVNYWNSLGSHPD